MSPVRKLKSSKVVQEANNHAVALWKRKNPEGVTLKPTTVFAIESDFGLKNSNLSEEEKEICINALKNRRNQGQNSRQNGGFSEYSNNSGYSNNQSKPKKDKKNKEKTVTIKCWFCDKTGAGWTDEQTITHVRNAFRGDLIDWYDSLGALGIDSKVWDNVKTCFETDFRAAPSVTSVVHKIPDIKQLEGESVIQYFSKALKTMEEFKTKIIQMDLVILAVYVTKTVKYVFLSCSSRLASIKTHTH